MTPAVAELARLCSWPITRRWHYDWTALEADLGITLPAEFKDYVAHFPPGAHGGVLTPIHPAEREGGRHFDERVRFVADALRGLPSAERPPKPFYPDPGGLIPWAYAEGRAALCWQPDGGDPDRWPVYAADGENRYEKIPGTTIEALINVLRARAGDSVFTKPFYVTMVFHGPWTFLGDERPPPDIELGDVEPLDGARAS